MPICTDVSGRRTASFNHPCAPRQGHESLQWNSLGGAGDCWRNHRHRPGHELPGPTRHAREWGLLPGHQWGHPSGHHWGPTAGQKRGLSHGHGHTARCFCRSCFNAACCVSRSSPTSGHLTASAKTSMPPTRRARTAAYGLPGLSYTGPDSCRRSPPCMRVGQLLCLAAARNIVQA